jgi:UMF1 family MFS transporter
MLTMPSIGAYADLRAQEALLMLTTAGCVVTTPRWRLRGPAAWRWPWC